MQIDGDTTRKNLIGIISRYGQNILEDPKKLKNLLLDLNQGTEKKEVNIICNSLDDMVPFDLIKKRTIFPITLVQNDLSSVFKIVTGLLKILLDGLWIHGLLHFMLFPTRVTFT